MDEKKQTETSKETTETDTPKETVQGKDDSTDRIPPKTETTPLIDVANAVAERIERGNINTAKLLDRQEELDARRALGATADAGAQPKKTEEETDEEYTAKFQRGEVNPMKEDVIKGQA